MGNGIHSILCCLILIHLPQRITQTLYKAAVVEYAPKRNFDYVPRLILTENANQYIEIIKEAVNQKIDIIIFPECGLTTLEVDEQIAEHLEAYSIELIIATDDSLTNPCDFSKNFHKILSELSCAAKTGKIYVVVNILEREIINRTNNFAFYSTNIVFDRNGAIIKRYRKINTHKEQSFTRGSDKRNIFKTDFNVTFGILIGADILNKNPAFDLFNNPKVTDVIYSTAWNSETPFLNGLSIQHGYAKKNNISLLSACLNDPNNNSSGSGIFFANGTIANISVSSDRKTMLLIHDLPIRSSRLVMEAELNYKEIIEQSKSELTNGNIRTSMEDMQNYTFDDIDTTSKCSTKNPFCCYTCTVVDTKNQIKSKYTYKLVSFFGVRRFGCYQSQNIAISVCALVCLKDNSTSLCDLRRTSSPMSIFQNISISATYENLEEVYVQPTTLRFDLCPISNYSYSEQKISESKKKYIVIISKPQDFLITFGVFGRVYGLDNENIGKLQYPRLQRSSVLIEKKDFKNKEEEASSFIIIIIITVVCAFLLLLAPILILKKWNGKWRRFTSNGGNEATVSTAIELPVINPRQSDQQNLL